MSAAITTLARLGLGASAAESPVTRRIDFREFDLGIEIELVDMNGTRGKYDEDDSRVRPNKKRIAPRLSCQPTATELTYLLPWILDGNPAGTSYPLGNSTALRSLAYDPGAGNLWNLPNVAVDEGSFRASEGGPLDVSLSLLGRSFTVAGTFPALSLDVATQPFLMTDCVLSIAAGVVQFREMGLTIRKNHDRERFFNTTELTAQNKLKREIIWSFGVPYGDNLALYNVAQNAAATVVATFTNGVYILTLTSSVRFRPKSPNSPFQQEAMLSLEGKAYSPDGTTTPLAVTLATS
jgi:hypothetical protein